MARIENPKLGAKQIENGKLFELRFEKNFLAKQFKCKFVNFSDFDEELSSSVKQGIVVVRKFGTQYRGEKIRRFDFMLMNPKNGKKVLVECRSQQVSGTAKEKVELVYSQSDRTKIPTLVVFGGDGYDDKYVNESKEHMLRFKHMKGLLNLKTQRKEIARVIKNNLGVR